MNDRTVRMSCVVATSIWILTVLVVLTGTIALMLDHGQVALALYAHAVLAVAAAVVATIKVQMERNVRLVLDALRLTDRAGGLRQIP